MIKRVVNTDPTSPVPADTVAILETVIEERDNAMQKWGVQNHPDGTHDIEWLRNMRDQQRKLVDRQAEEGRANWYDILKEEVFEAGCEEDLVALDKELCQVMQVALVWREDIRRRQGFRTLTMSAEGLSPAAIGAITGMNAEAVKAAMNADHDAAVQTALSQPLPSSARRPVTGPMEVVEGNGPAYGSGRYTQVNDAPTS
jgi:hypothetical protein